jgi:hypothetical protein
MRLAHRDMIHSNVRSFNFISPTWFHEIKHIKFTAAKIQLI